MATTWHDVETAVQEWARYDWLAGYYDSESVHNWAHETADGCEYVIYYHHQNDLWREPEVQQYEDDTYGDDIQHRIMQCVYLAIYEALLDAATDVMESDSVLGVRQSEQYVRIHGEGMYLPMLETYAIPRARA